MYHACTQDKVGKASLSTRCPLKNTNKDFPAFLENVRSAAVEDFQK